MMEKDKTKSIKDKIRTIADFPKKGIMFRDITTLLQDKQGLKDVISELVKRYKNSNIDVVAGIEARGFILGGTLAYKLGVGFVPLRKKGKLPYKTESITYNLEYGQDTIELHVDSIKKGDNVLLVDDLIATAGTACASADLITRIGGKIFECVFIVELPDLKGKEKLEERGYKMFSLVKFSGE
jgi:adenine phosphoribosyltransferase